MLRMTAIEAMHKALELWRGSRALRRGYPSRESRQPRCCCVEGRPKLLVCLSRRLVGWRCSSVGTLWRHYPRRRERLSGTGAAAGPRHRCLEQQCRSSSKRRGTRKRTVTMGLVWTGDFAARLSCPLAPREPLSSAGDGSDRLRLIVPRRALRGGTAFQGSTCVPAAGRGEHVSAQQLRA